MINDSLKPLSKPTDLIGRKFGEYDYNVITKDDVDQILKTFYETFITSGALSYVLQKDISILHLSRAWGWGDTPTTDQMYEILEEIDAQEFLDH